MVKQKSDFTGAARHQLADDIVEQFEVVPVDPMNPELRRHPVGDDEGNMPFAQNRQIFPAKRTVDENATVAGQKIPLHQLRRA
ncbi:hypothetical protein SDC9_110925 [bioreactor metagenome]|uniref:Uncharacterized protein n=1 Tax=bioreactor metagenome TaxID=1076179 RepID=A0A645BF16_9ZZZZ